MVRIKKAQKRINGRKLNKFYQNKKSGGRAERLLKQVYM